MQVYDNMSPTEAHAATPGIACTVHNLELALAKHQKAHPETKEPRKVRMKERKAAEEELAAAPAAPVAPAASGVPGAPAGSALGGGGSFPGLAVVAAAVLGPLVVAAVLGPLGPVAGVLLPPPRPGSRHSSRIFAGASVSASCPPDPPPDPLQPPAPLPATPRVLVTQSLSFPLSSSKQAALLRQQEMWNKNELANRIIKLRRPRITAVTGSVPDAKTMRAEGRYFIVESSTYCKRTGGGEEE